MCVFTHTPPCNGINAVCNVKTKAAMPHSSPLPFGANLVGVAPERDISASQFVDYSLQLQSIRVLIPS
jgi:hypothetical protein